MARSVVSIEQQHFEITNVTDVIVSAIEQDPDVGDYVRTIQIWGTPASGTSNLMVMQLRIRATIDTTLKIISPETEF